MRNRLAVTAIIAACGLFLLGGCDYDDLKQEAAFLHEEVQAILSDAGESGALTPPQADRLEDIEARVGEINETIQGADDWFGLGDAAVGSLGTAVPGAPLIWAIVSGIWKRRTKTLVRNIDRARTGSTDSGGISLDGNTLRALNSAAGLDGFVRSARAIE